MPAREHCRDVELKTQLTNDPRRHLRRCAPPVAEKQSWTYGTKGSVIHLSKVQTSRCHQDVDRRLAIQIAPFDLLKMLALPAKKLADFAEVHHTNSGARLTSRLSSQLG
jgi:hypothetical protein